MVTGACRRRISSADCLGNPAAAFLGIKALVALDCRRFVWKCIILHHGAEPAREISGVQVM
jgi:hypothetical protein